MTQFPAQFAQFVPSAGPLSACVYMSLGRQDLASLKWYPGKPGQPGSHVNQISQTYKNNIRGEISPLRESARLV